MTIVQLLMQLVSSLFHILSFHNIYVIKIRVLYHLSLLFLWVHGVFHHYFLLVLQIQRWRSSLMWRWRTWRLLLLGFLRTPQTVSEAIRGQGDGIVVAPLETPKTDPYNCNFIWKYYLFFGITTVFLTGFYSWKCKKSNLEMLWERLTWKRINVT